MSDIERIREASPLAEIAAEYTDLGPSGAKLKGRCPLPVHDDRTPSFVVYPEDESFYCFGCARGGDVFDFVKHIHGIDFRGALETLADRAGIRLNDRNSDPAQEKRSATLNHAVETAAKRLTPDHRKYLHGRGLSDEIIERLRIGTGRDGEIILPVLRHGRPIYFIRHYPDRPQGNRYIFPRKDDYGPKPLVGAERLRMGATIYVVEGYFDWVALIQSGFDAVALLGSTAKVEQLDRPDHLYLLLDGDTSGMKAADKLAAELYPKARIVELPEGDDPASLASKPGNGFRAEIERLAAEATDALQRRLLAFEVAEDDDQANILSEMTNLLARLEGYALDTAVSRVHAKVKGQGIRKATITLEVEKARAVALARPQSRSSSSGDMPSRVQPDPEIEKEAAALLKRPNILSNMVEATNQLGHQGESLNRKMVMLAGVAGHTASSHEDAIHIVVKGGSASGKNELLRRVLALFPPSRVRFLTGVSQQALVYAGGRIEGILVFQEAEGEEHGEYVIRQAMSEGKLERMTVIDGKPQTVETYVCGSILTTTTEVALHDENQTRVFDLHTDETQELTRKVIDAVGSESQGIGGSDSERQKIRSIWRAALAKLEAADVVIPFASVIAEKFPDRLLRARRDIRRTFNLVRACAVLHQEQRERDVSDRLIASIDDYRMVYPLIQAVLGPSMSGLTEKAKRIVALHKELAVAGDGWVSRAELQRAAHDRNVASEKTVQKWARRFTNMGAWESRQPDGKWQHRQLHDIEEEPIDLPKPDELVDLVMGGKEGNTSQTSSNHADSGKGGKPGNGKGVSCSLDKQATAPEKTPLPATKATTPKESRASSEGSAGSRELPATTTLTRLDEKEVPPWDEER